METAILVAIISSSTAILVAIVGIIFNSRNQKKTSFELEQLKMMIDLKKKRLDINQALLNETISAIDLALQCSQKIKDDIHLLTNYLKFQSPLTKEWLEKTREEIHEYSDVFGKIFPKLADAEKTAMHDMKKELHQVDFLIARILHEGDKRQPIEKEKFVELLIVTKNRLSELQNNLLVRKSIYNSPDENNIIR